MKVLLSTLPALAAVSLIGAACSSSTPSSSSPSSPGTSAVNSPQTSSSPSLASELLSISDLPAGWAVDNSPNSGGGISGCQQYSAIRSKALTKAETQFDQSGGVPYLAEELGTFADAATDFTAGTSALNGCKNFSITDSGKTYEATMGQMSFPASGYQSAAYAISATVDGIGVGFDVVLLRKANAIAVVELGDIGGPSTDDLEQFVTTAVNKIP